MSYKPSELLIEEDLENSLEEDEELTTSFSEEEGTLVKTAKNSRKSGMRDVEIRRSIEEHLERKRRQQSGEYFDLDELANFEGLD